MSSFQTSGYSILKKLPFFFRILLEFLVVAPIEHADFGFVLDPQLVQGLSVSGDGVGSVLAEQNPVVIVVQVYNQLHRLGAMGLGVDLKGVVCDVTVWSQTTSSVYDVAKRLD